MGYIFVTLTFWVFVCIEDGTYFELFMIFCFFELFQFWKYNNINVLKSFLYAARIFLIHLLTIYWYVVLFILLLNIWIIFFFLCFFMYLIKQYILFYSIKQSKKIHIIFFINFFKRKLNQKWLKSFYLLIYTLGTNEKVRI